METIGVKMNDFQAHPSCSSNTASGDPKCMDLSSCTLREDGLRLECVLASLKPTPTNNRTELRLIANVPRLVAYTGNVVVKFESDSFNNGTSMVNKTWSIQTRKLL